MIWFHNLFYIYVIHLLLDVVSDLHCFNAPYISLMKMLISGFHLTLATNVSMIMSRWKFSMVFSTCDRISLWTYAVQFSAICYIFKHSTTCVKYNIHVKCQEKYPWKMFDGRFVQKRHNQAFIDCLNQLGPKKYNIFWLRISKIYFGHEMMILMLLLDLMLILLIYFLILNVWTRHEIMILMPSLDLMLIWLILFIILDVWTRQYVWWQWSVHHASRLTSPLQEENQRVRDR